MKISLFGVLLCLTHSLHAQDLAQKLWAELKYASGTKTTKEVEREDEKFLADAFDEGEEQNPAIAEDSISTSLAAPQRKQAPIKEASPKIEERDRTRLYKTRARSR